MMQMHVHMFHASQCDDLLREVAFVHIYVQVHIVSESLRSSS